MFSGWNYRIAFKVYGEEKMYGIYEVYYDEETGRPSSSSVENMRPLGSSLEELKGDFEYMKLAFDKPVLNWETLEDE